MITTKSLPWPVACTGLPILLLTWHLHLPSRCTPCSHLLSSSPISFLPVHLFSWTFFLKAFANAVPSAWKAHCLPQAFPFFPWGNHSLELFPWFFNACLLVCFSGSILLHGNLSVSKGKALIDSFNWDMLPFERMFYIIYVAFLYWLQLYIRITIFFYYSQRFNKHPGAFKKRV